MLVRLKYFFLHGGAKLVSTEALDTGTGSGTETFEEKDTPVSGQTGSSFSSAMH